MIILPNVPLSEAIDYINTNGITLDEFNPIVEYLNLYESIDYDIYKATQSLYLDSINESSIEAINESFSDFIEKIKAVIKKIKEFILSLIDKFISLFKKKEKTIKLTVTGMSPDIQDKLNEALKNAGKSLNGINKDYIYPKEDTNRYIFNDEIPVNNAVVNYTEDVLHLFRNTKGGYNKLDEKGLAKKIKASKEELNTNLNLARGKILRKTNAIDKESFEEECTKLFIKGKRDFVSENFMDEAVDIIKNDRFKKELGELEKKKKEVITMYDKVSKSLDEMASINIKDGENRGSVTLHSDNNNKYKDADYDKINVDLLKSLDSLLNKAISGVNDLANNHAYAFSIKLDCYKKYYAQCIYTVKKMEELDKKLKEKNKNNE